MLLKQAKGGGEMTEQLLLLMIRNLIAEREANTAAANRELQSGDGWLWDHAQRDRELATTIEAMIEQAKKEAAVSDLRCDCHEDARPVVKATERGVKRMIEGEG
jgi:hypothetical protein